MASSITLSDFECVYKTYYIRLYHYAYNFVNDADVSNDIVSEVFYKSWKNYRHIDKDKMPSFLYVCVRNECMNHLRKKRGMNKYIEYCKAAFSEEDDNYWQTMEERIKELENILMQECEKYENDCTTCPYSKECEEYARLYSSK